jgi:hypothetical protein
MLFLLRHLLLCYHSDKTTHRTINTVVSHAEIRKLCVQQLGINTEALSAEDICRRILDSQHARDFFISDDTIRNWRSKDANYRRHGNDRMSVEALV